MKKIILIIAIIVSGSAYSKNTIPGPFWYNISEKILAETHQLMGADMKAPTKAKTLKAAKPVKNNLKCQTKKDIVLPVPYFTISSNGMWIVN
jgi:hypothetical protein